MRQLRILTIRALAISLLLFTNVGAQIIDCAPKEKGAPKYTVGWRDYSVEGPRTLFLSVSVGPRHFNRNDMATLAHRLNRDFCKEQKLFVAVLDDHRAARAFSPTNETQWFHRHVRGYYDLDRNLGTETISFSTDPSKPRDEVKISLN